jgi:dTDP-4-dehydrorhamnose reductase
LADVTAHAIRTLQTRPELAGLYHCIAAGETTWHGYAQFVLAEAEALGLPLKATADKVAPTPTSSYPTPAMRPLNSRLDTRKLQAAFGLTLPHWQAGVKRMLIEISGK